MISKLEQLKVALADGSFHHATYRNIGNLWEGLYIYRNDDAGMRGFSILTSFGKDDPDLPAAEAMVRHTGVSVGAFGEG